MRLLAAVVLSATVAACGGSSSDAERADVRAYAALAQEISGAASSYATAAGATSDVPGCQSAQGAYAAQVRPMLDRMHAMSGGMDREMGMMGPATHADMTCGADAMLAELARHAAVACSSGDMAVNHAEAARHSDEMHDWAEHQQARAGEMGGMMGMGGMDGGGAAATCRQGADGTFTLAP
jgi:hypothetical protein